MIDLPPHATSSPTWKQWRRRVAGSLLMAACAEALRDQIPTEADLDDLLPAPHRELQFGPLTTRTLALALHLVRRTGGGDVQPVSSPAGADGAESARHRRAQDAGAAATFEPRARTCGPAAAWIAPVGLLPHVTLTVVAGHARALAGEGDHVGQDVAAGQAVAVAVAARGKADEPVDLDRVITTIAAHTNTPDLRTALQVVRALAHRGTPAAEVTRHLIDQHPAVTAFSVAVHAFLTNADDPYCGLRDALLAPYSDARIAPMAAAVIGARIGDDRVPQQWGSRLRSSLQVWTVAGELAELINPTLDADSPDAA